MKTLTVCANAKLNLSLDITGVLEDGYHTLQTIMQTIDLSDEITLTKADTIQCRTNCPSLPTGLSNLAAKAAREFFLQTGISGGVEIHIRKRIPSEAGMGGGSADAAAVLRGLNRLYDTHLSAEALQAIGKRVGADVLFCVAGGAALAEGIGETLTPLGTSLPAVFVVIKPSVGVSTPDAYRAFDRLSSVRHPDTDALLVAHKAGDPRRFCRHTANVLEPAVALLGVQEVFEAKEALQQTGALASCMTGSGSAVFGVFADEALAEASHRALKERFDQVWVCRPTGRVM